MSSKMIKKISLRYQIFAIFSIVFQSFFPLINIFAPVQALNASSNASQSATVEVVAEVAEAVEVVESEESAEVANDSVEVLSNSVETLPVDVVVDTIDEPLPSVDDDADKPAETPATENPTAQTESESESLQPEKNQAQPATAEVGEFYVSHAVVNNPYFFTDSLGQEVKLTFTKIDGPAGDLTIKEVQLSEDQQKSVGALSLVAYDITSSMENGSFQYNLSISLPDDPKDNLDLVYASDLSSLESSQKVDSVAVDSEAIKAEGLDHFTIFVVVNPLPGGVNNGDACVVMSTSGTCYDTLQSAVDAAATSGDTIELKSDLTTTSRVNIAKSLTINGNGFTINPTFTKVGNSNNAVFIISGETNTVVINNLKINGVGGTNLHGINVYVSNLVLNDVEINNNDNTAINVNGSHVSIHNFKSTGNRGNLVYGVIDLDKGSGVTRNPVLTVTGQSQHGENVDIKRIKGSVVDTNGQYDSTNYWFFLAYTLKSAPAVPINLAALVSDNTVNASWNSVPYASSYDYEITGPAVRNGNVLVTNASETGLPNGSYEIRVRGVAQSGLAGDWSATVPFTINYNPHPDPMGENQLSLGGTVYRDKKMNDCFGLASCYDKAENLGAGWTMNLYQEDGGGSWSLLQSVQTNSSGNFGFTQLTEAGTYHFCEVVKPGWTQQVQNWSGTPYHIATANMSGNSAEGPYCRTVQYDDTADRGNSAYFGNVDTTNPQIQNLKYFKDSVEVLTPPTTPILVNSIDQLTYSADYLDGESGLNRTAFVIWDATDSWTPVSGSHKCNWNSTPSNTTLDGSGAQSLAGIALKKCNPGYSWPSGKYLIAHVVYDNAGNHSYNLGGSQRFIIDQNAPAKPAGLRYFDPATSSEIACGAVISKKSIYPRWDANSEADFSHYEYTSFDVSSNPPGWVIGLNEAVMNSTTFVHSWIPPVDGTYGFAVRAVDLAGNKSDWAIGGTKTLEDSCQYTVDSIAPSIPVNGYPHNIVLNSNVFNYTWDPSTDNLGGSITYEYQASQNPAQTDGVLTSGLWQSWVHGNPSQNPLTGPMIPSVGTSDGTWYWQVRAVDAVGNKSGWSEIWHYTLDSVAPTAPVISTPVSEQYFKATPILNEWQAALDSGTGVVKYQVAYLYDDLHTFAGSTCPGEEISSQLLSGCRDVSGLSRNHIPGLSEQGGVTIWVRAIDNAGNVGAWSDPVHYYYDATPPTSTIVPPESALEIDGNTVILNSWDGLISGTSADDLSGVKQVWLSVENSDGKFWDGDSWETGDEASIRIPLVTTGDWDYTLSPAPVEGIYTIKSHAEDNAGNLENTAVLIIIYDKTIPEVNLTINPASPDGKRNWYITQPTITLTATDLNDIERIEYQWNSTSGTWTTYTGPINPGQGNNQFYYRAIDKASNASEIGTKTVLFDKEEPSNPETMEIERNGKNPTISWSKAKDNVGIHGYKVILTHKTEDISKSTSVGSNVREVTFDDLEDGEWKVAIHTEDLAGWSVSRSQNMSIGGSGDVAGVISDIQEGIISPLLRNTVGEVFGATDENNDTSDTNDENSADGVEQLAQADGMEGQVAGASTECKPWQNYLPIILLVLQLLALLMVELTLKSSTMSKVVLELLITVGVILLAQYLKNANCFTDGSFLGMLNHWFWLVSVALGAGVRAFSEFLVNED